MTKLVIPHQVTKGGAAEGKLRVNDTLLRINNLDTVSVDRRVALQALWGAKGGISLVSKYTYI